MINFYLKWTATAVTILGALLTSIHSPFNVIVLNVASLIWLIWSLRINEKSLIVVNISMLGIYLLGALFW